MALILVIRLFQYNPDMTLHPGMYRIVVVVVVGSVGGWLVRGVCVSTNMHE